jgi:hypothetical protein
MEVQHGVTVTQAFPRQSHIEVAARPLLRFASTGERAALEAALEEEERSERERDRIYWAPLRRELERLRHGGRR